jgi:hypothetical protein
MTHKYINNIRTIPNYHENNSDLAKTYRKISLGAKATLNFIIKSKKTRVISSVLAVYLIVTSGFMVALLNLDGNNANASEFGEVGMSIVVKDQNIVEDKVTMSIEVENNSKTIISNPILELNSTNKIIKWEEVVSFQTNSIKTISESKILGDSIDIGEKNRYKVQGKITNSNSPNLVINIKSTIDSKEVNSPKYFVFNK